MLTVPLGKLKGQCAYLAGCGIQGELLAKVLHKANGVIMIPRKCLALRIRFLYKELGCTPEAGPPAALNPSSWASLWLPACQFACSADV